MGESTRAEASATPAAHPHTAPLTQAPQTQAALTQAGRGADLDVGVARSSAIMAAGTVLSRALGFVRASLLAAAIGLGYASGDAFTVANTLPNIIYMLLAGSVLNAVLVPAITRAASEGDAGKAFVDRLVTLSVVVMAGVTLLVIALAPLLTRLYIADSVTGAEVGLAVAFAYWCLPQVLFYGLYSVWGQVLNARGSFGAYTWAPIVNNVVAIAGLVLFVALYGFGVKPLEQWSAGAIAVLAGSATLGVAAQAFLLVPFLRRSGYTWRPRWGVRGAQFGAVGTMAAWTFAGMLLTQAAFTVTSTVLTAAGQAGEVAMIAEAGHGSTGGIRASLQIYSNAFLLFMLPHSIITVSLVTALFTRMSAAAGRADLDAVRGDLSLGLRLTLLVTVPATTFMLAMGPAVTAVLFPGNEAPETRGTGLGAAAMTLGLAAFSGNYLLQRVFYAFEDARAPFVAQLPAILMTVLLALAVGAFVPPDWAVVGIGLAMSAANAVSFALAAFLLRGRLGNLDGRRVRRVAARVLLAACAATLGCWLTAALTQGGLERAVQAPPLAVDALSLLAAVTVMAALYLIGLRALGVTELNALLAAVRGRRRPHDQR